MRAPTQLGDVLLGEASLARIIGMRTEAGGRLFFTSEGYQRDERRHELVCVSSGHLTLGLTLRRRVTTLSVFIQRGERDLARRSPRQPTRRARCQCQCR
jgi:hypothetical protein